jgi:hypothetical protein
MKKYEYKAIISLSPLADPYLNTLGSQGWELISVIGSNSELYKNYFKREMELKDEKV